MPTWTRTSGPSSPRRSVLRLIALSPALYLLGSLGSSTAYAQETSEPPLKGYSPVAELKWSRWPLDNMSSVTTRFGEATERGTHRGTDLGAVPYGTFPFIYAPADGTVVNFLNSYDAEYDQPTFGIAVCLDHEQTPWYSLYAHMTEAYVSVGDKVKAGQVIGKMGYTGTVLPKGPGGTHLHWQVCKSSQFPTDISYSTDPMAIPLVAASASTAGITEGRVREIVGEVLDSRKMERNFADSMTKRISGIHDATDPAKPLRDQLAGIRAATDLNNPDFIA